MLTKSLHSTSTANHDPWFTINFTKTPGEPTAKPQINEMKIHIIAASVLLISSGALLAKDSQSTEIERLFTLKVKPMLSEKCFGCHGAPDKKLKGGLDVTSREKFVQGGHDFPNALVPGSSPRSYVLKMVKWEDEDYEMPPKKNDRLTEEQIKDFGKWIDAGAPWLSEERQKEIHLAEQNKKRTKDGIMVKTSGGLADEWTFRRYQPEDIWAFQSVRKPKLPNLGDRNAIDALVGSKLEKSGFKAAAKSNYHTLIRRATYDLTGLPPTLTEVYKFGKAYQKDADKAWRDLVDRLLASKHYGERWAQHWLDVARYSDTGGYSNDYERSNMWRYRDWVIKALNEDKPYDQFVIEQLAGDELADRSLAKRITDPKKLTPARANGKYNEKESALLVASSFLRMGPWDPAMVKKPEARQLFLDDVVNAVGQTFLSTTMRCFKCHDHKFDPLPTRDYYRFYSAFSGTQLSERKAPFHEGENQAGFEEGKVLIQRLQAFAQARVKELTTKRENEARRWYKERDLPYQTLNKRKGVDDEKKPPRHCGLSPVEQGRLKVREQDVWIWTRRLERYQPFVQTVYNGQDPGFLNARKLRMNAKANMDWRPDSTILTGGSLEAPGEQVAPGVLSALGVPTSDAKEHPYLVTDELEGRRLALAKWIADPRNPLTARSIVNRVWQYHFGKAIAGNPNNFGVKGSKPTHPRLLDWLAADFVENGWQIKRLHRLIMASNTYQQSGRHSDMEKLRNDDPNNDLFAYFPSRRLTAEEIRDGMLKISGELNTDSGGLPIMPEMNLEVALQPRMIQFSLAPAYQPSRTPEERNRRSIYAYRVRGLANPFLETFNQPNPNDSCEDRDAASVSPQAFTLLNSDVVTARSIAYALRVEKEEATLSKQIDRAIRLAFSRNPTQQEKNKLLAYVKEMRAYHEQVKPESKEYPTQITRSLVEEFTGQPFEYEEILPAFENYVPDKQAADVGPNTRALADLCLLLFNSNEFVFLY
ncbi:MAG: mono/diheme cytochrome c family protein [Limisphaerales bacterium]